MLDGDQRQPQADSVDTLTGDGRSSSTLVALTSEELSVAIASSHPAEKDASKAVQMVWSRHRSIACAGPVRRR